MTITGTNHFVSLRHAERYYDDYQYDDVRKTVQRKVKEGEIAIGPPKLKPGQKLFLTDNGRRYAVEG